MAQILMLNMSEAAKRVDKCLNLFVHGHQKPDGLRQDLIQELMNIYEKGVRDAWQLKAERAGKVPDTKRQAEILEYFRSFKERNGHVPTYMQVARHFGFSSKATIAKQVQALRRQGFEVQVRSNGSRNQTERTESV